MKRPTGSRRVFGRPTKTPAETRTAARKRFFNEARLATPYVSVEVKELTFFVSTSDRLAAFSRVAGGRTSAISSGRCVC